jgi:hypothetical protein
MKMLIMVLKLTGSLNLIGMKIKLSPIMMEEKMMLTWIKYVKKCGE